MLRNLAKNRLQMTAAKEMAKEKILHKIYLANLKNQEKIKGIIVSFKLVRKFITIPNKIYKI